MLVKMAKATIKIPTMTNVGRTALRSRPTRRLLKLSSLLTPVQSRNWWLARKRWHQILLPKSFPGVTFPLGVSFPVSARCGA